MPVELTISGMAAGGDAIARDDDGKVTFVTGALPGERVRVEITDRRRDFDRAATLEVLDAAPGRISAPCPHVARGCGGCGWQHVALDAQRQLKLDIVRDALRRIGRLDEPSVEIGVPLDPFGFRTTVRLARGVGFRHARSHDVVDVDSCLVAHPLLADLFGVDYGRAREVTLRCGARTGDRLVLTDPGRIRLELPEGVHVGPRSFVHEIVAGHRFRVSAHSFFQTRPDGADALVAAVRAAAHDAPEGRLVDAYGGVGLFAATLGREATIIEQSPSSVLDARHNVPGAKVVQSDVARWRPSPAALVVADPPRTGLGADAVDGLSRTGASHLVLVSCDPAALARDARLLADAGFEHHGTTLVDLFPHTPHVETVTRFIR
jgi:23S rRNA (uracil1939-C5)-methyltransferase